MLLNLREYHRPTGGYDWQAFQNALAMLARGDVRTAVLAGGNDLLGQADPTVEAVVDLQELGLNRVTLEAGRPDRLRIGAMVTRTALAEDPTAQAIYGGILAEGARRWSGSVQRNLATIGGAVATAAANDPLIAALLACDATVVLHLYQGVQTMPISGFLPRRVYILAIPALITDLVIACPSPPIGGAIASVGRTPADAPIVLAAAALAAANGQCQTARLALGGVADAPLRLSEIEEQLIGKPLSDEAIASAAAQVAELVRPAGDFRGSAEYRRAMAGVLARRALCAAWERSNATHLHPEQPTPDLGDHGQ